MSFFVPQSLFSINFVIMIFFACLLSRNYQLFIFPFLLATLTVFNRPNSVERDLASTPKMEYQVFLCIFQKNSTMATLCLKEITVGF